MRLLAKNYITTCSFQALNAKPLRLGLSAAIDKLHWQEHKPDPVHFLPADRCKLHRLPLDCIDGWWMILSTPGRKGVNAETVKKIVLLAWMLLIGLYHPTAA